MFVDLSGFLEQKSQVIGGTAVKLTAPTNDIQGLQRPDKVIVQALTSNMYSIMLKNKSDVVADGSAGGFELPPGANIILPITTYEDFYAIAGAAGQRLQLQFCGGPR